MGKTLSKRVRIVMLGLDGAGKTTIIHKLKSDQPVKVVTPTEGFNVETVEYKNIEFKVVDVGGKKIDRLILNHFLDGADGIIFVVDSADRDRIDDARTELYTTMANGGIKDAKILIFANKQDLPDAMTAKEIQEKFGLTGLKGRKWHVQPSTATSGDGLPEGLKWLV